MATEASPRVAIVTGAASGIGRAIAERLCADGLHVLAVDVAPDEDGPGTPFAADLTTREGNRACVDAALERFGRLDAVIANAGVQHVAPIAEFPEDRWDTIVALLLTSPFAADLTTREGNRACVDAALERFGRLDAVIANAGVQHVAPIAEFPEDRWDTIVALLLTSPFLLAKHAWPALAQAPAGRFVAIASAHALVASPYKAAYVSAKHGVLGLVRTLALEGAADGITATAICPGFVRTPLVERQIADQAAAHGIEPERVLDEVILEPHAVKRLIEPDEVAAAVAFVLSDAGAAFSGAPLTMDLGWTAR